MKTYEFDRNDFIFAEEFYNVFQQKLKLPSWFGKNADALWDVLTGYIEFPVKFRLINFNKKENQYNKMVIDKIMNCFLDAQNQFPSQIIVEIK